jgi:SAM-dependent methyltransferase
LNNILAILNESQIAVDLGCGAGSFDYLSYRCRIVGIDASLDNSVLRRSGNRIDYVKSVSDEIPLAPQSVDAVICNHTLEHFTNYAKALQEIRRILKPDGYIWISVPNGFGFDDLLYRVLFTGGGHVNRFSFQSMVDAVEKNTGLPLLQSSLLFSSFTYLTKFNHRYSVFVLNAGTRIIDKLLGTRSSLYGWGFVFGRDGSALTPLYSYFNVCCACGAGDPFDRLNASANVRRRFGFRFFNCLHCGAANVLMTPPPGLS